MKYIQLFESWNREEEITLTSRQGREITMRVKHGKIEEIDNESGVPFPFFTGQPVTVFMKGWACNHGFKWNGENACDPGEKKVFGIKTKYIPKEPEWRKIWPGKFRAD
jgi:hypothetical protein